MLLATFSPHDASMTVKMLLSEEHTQTFAKAMLLYPRVYFHEIRGMLSDMKGLIGSQQSSSKSSVRGKGHVDKESQGRSSSRED